MKADTQLRMQFRDWVLPFRLVCRDKIPPEGRRGIQPVAVPHFSDLFYAVIGLSAEVSDTPLSLACLLNLRKRPIALLHYPKLIS